MKHIFTSIICLLFFINIFKGQSLEAELNNIATSNDMMGGAAIVFCENGIIETYYYGKSDFQRDFDVDEDTKFRIASISKTITAIAIMQLVEQNLLDLNADISNILGFDVKNPNHPDEPITVKMLLSHTSTIIDGPTYSSFLQATVNDYPIPNLSEILTPSGTFYNAGQFNTTEPGTYFNYSNINFVILGTIVEIISSQRFDVYCYQNIFQPLGLDASFNVNDLNDIDDVAVLYRKNNGIWVPQVDNYQGVQPQFNNLLNYFTGTNGGRFGPQGGVRCSARDLAEIFMCLFNPDMCDFPILSEQSVAGMIEDNWTFSGNNGNNYFGLFRSWGLGIHRITATPLNDIVLPGSSIMYGHPGEAYGLVSDLYYDPVRKVGIVFMTNGVGAGYQLNGNSAFYTIEKAVFDAIESYGNPNSCLTVSVDPDLHNVEAISIYPNPSKDAINVSMHNFKESVPAMIYSLDGLKVMELTIDAKESILDISNLKKGIYMLQVNEHILRFIKS